MSTDYSVVTKRIIEERIRLELSPKEMAGIIYINQRNYMKVEKELRRFSYAELKYLCASPVDVQYIFTGNKCGETFKSYFAQCQYEQLVGILNFISSISIVLGTEEAREYMNKVYISTEVLGGNDKNKTSEVNMFYLLRRLNGYRQLEMAELLGVDPKKLRDLENNRCLPDSELIWRMYRLFRLSPGIVLRDKACLINEISFKLEILKPEIQDKILDLVEVIYSINL